MTMAYAILYSVLIVTVIGFVVFSVGYTFAAIGGGVFGFFARIMGWIGMPRSQTERAESAKAERQASLERRLARDVSRGIKIGEKVR